MHWKCGFEFSDPLDVWTSEMGVGAYTVIHMGHQKEIVWIFVKIFGWELCDPYWDLEMQ